MKILHLSRLLFAIATFCFSLSIFFIWQRTTPQRLAFSEVTATTEAQRTTDLPMALEIDSRNIDVPIYPARVTAKEWETTAAGVSYLVSSPLPGNRGNSIIYGHNWRSILGNLKDITKDDKIIVTFRSGINKKFTVAYTITVTPDQTHVLDQTDDNRITLYTCTGFLDRQRLVVVALLDK